MISKGYHYVINLGFVSNFYITIDISTGPVYPGSLAKDLSQQVKSGESGISLLHKSSRFCSPSNKRPLVASCSLVLYPEGEQETNSIIRGSSLKKHKPPFWISVNLSDTVKTHTKQKKHYFCVTLGEKMVMRNQLFLVWCI